MMLITSGGTLVRTRVVEVSVMGRNTQGVRLIRLSDDEQLTGMACIANIPTEVDVDIDVTVETDDAVVDVDPSSESKSDQTDTEE